MKEEEIFGIRTSFLKKREENVLQASDHREHLLQQMREKQAERLQLTRKPEKKVTSKNDKHSEESSEINKLRSELAKTKIELKQKKAALSKEKKTSKQLRKKTRQLEESLSETKNETNHYFLEKTHKIEKEKAEFEKVVSKLRTAGWDEKGSALEEIELRNKWILFLMQGRIDTKRYLNDAYKRDNEHNKEIKILENKNNQLEFNNTRRQKLLNKKNTQLEDLRIEHKRVKSHLRKLQSRFDQLHSPSPRTSLRNLTDQLTVENFDHYRDANRLFEKYTKIFEINSRKVQAVDERLYGYLEISEDNYFFHDLNEELVLPLILPVHFKRYDLLRDGMVIQVSPILEEELSAFLIYCYPLIQNYQSTDFKVKEQKKKQKKERDIWITNEEVLRWAKTIHITVVGSKRTKNFVDELSRYVDSVTVVNTYEDGEKITFERIKASDYSFVLTDSVPHSVMDFLKQYDPELKKTQTFYLPAKEDGAVRLNY